MYVIDPTAEKGTILNPYTIEEAESIGIDTDDVIENGIEDLSEIEKEAYESTMQEFFTCDNCGGTGWV